VKVGVVGTGALGRHHVRILSELPQAELVGIYDRRPEVAAELSTRHKSRAFDDLDSLAGRCEAMVVAVPTESHGQVGCQLLERGIHVMVEKPIAPSLEEADRLLAAADRAQKVLAVGHVEFYNPAVQKLLSLDFEPRYVEVQRLGTFSRRSLDVDVLLDLMIHDLQILHALDPSPVAEVRATGINVLSSRVDIANARVALESGCVANLTASRVSLEKTRKLRLFGRNSYCSLDYHEQEIKGYRLEVQEGEEPRIVEASPHVTPYEPLKAELEAFLAACRGEPVRYADGKDGRRALETALALVAAIC